jgi:hypothetical protein
LTIPRWRLHEERGAVAVEFALIASLLIALVFGLIEFGRSYSEYQVFLNAAREGARKGAVRADKGSILEAVDKASAGYEITPPVSITVNEADASDPPCNDDSVGDDLRVSWNQVFSIRIPFLPDFHPTVLIQGVFRCE